MNITTKKKRKQAACGIFLFLTITGIALFFGAYLVQMRNQGAYPAEYRDCAVFKLVSDLAAGKNPYAVNQLNADPGVVLDSGFLNIFPAVCLAWLGLSASRAVYLTNFLYLLLCTGLTVKICNNLCSASQQKGQRLLNGAAACLWLLPFMQRSTYLVSRPDILCVVLLLAIAELFTRPVQKEWHLVVSALCCVLIAFAKIHYAVITAAILVELFCRKGSKKWQHIFLFCLSGILFAAAFFALTQWMFPAYLSEWIPRILAMFLDNKTFDEASPVVLLNKLQRILKSVWPLLVILAVGAVLAAKNSRKTRMPQGLRFLALNLAVNLLAFIYVGRHPGADLWYFYVMVIPSLVILGVYALASLGTYPLLYYAALVLCIPCWCKNLIPIITDAKQSGAYAAGFQDAYTTLDKYSSQELYISPVLGNYCIQHKFYNYNYGDTFYLVDDAFADRFYRIPLAKQMLPYTKEIYAQHTAYVQNLEEKIENQELSVIALDTVDSVPIIDNQHFYDLVEKYYTVAEQTTDLQVDHMKITISYWIPKTTR